MTQKIVTFEVAKALKEAGYPIELPSQIETGGVRIPKFPSYIDTWLWLWREKKTEIEMQALSYARGRVRVWPEYFKSSKVFESTDPEEAIAKAIDYLVENNLIK